MTVWGEDGKLSEKEEWIGVFENIGCGGYMNSQGILRILKKLIFFFCGILKKFVIQKATPK